MIRKGTVSILVALSCLILGYLAGTLQVFLWGSQYLDNEKSQIKIEQIDQNRHKLMNIA